MHACRRIYSHLQGKTTLHDEQFKLKSCSLNPTPTNIDQHALWPILTFTIGIRSDATKLFLRFEQVFIRQFCADYHKVGYEE